MFARTLVTTLSKRFPVQSATHAAHFNHSIPVSQYCTNHAGNENKTLEPKQRTSLRLRRQKLPPFPRIETLGRLVVESFLKANFKTVKYGEYEFKECLDGYVHIYVSGEEIVERGMIHCGYAVLYGKEHPLNISGPVERRQKLNHACLYGVLQALKAIPTDSFKKVCICVNELTLINFIARVLREMSENSFRSTRSGKLNKDLDTCMELNTIIRERQDLTIRLKFVPTDIGVMEVYHAGKRARRAAEEALKESKSKSYLD